MSKFDLEKDLNNSSLIKDKIKDDIYAQHLYCALCNTEWQKIDMLEILEGNVSWTGSWRYNGGIIANLRNKNESYLDFYCSGIMNDEDEKNSQLVSEGTVTDEIREDLKSIGWKPIKVNYV